MPSVRVLEPARASFTVNCFNLTPAAAPTDIVTLRGAAGKIIQVRRIAINGIATTSGQLPILLYKRTAINTAGTFTTPAGVPMDTGDGVAAAVVNQYSINPTAIGAGSIIRSGRVWLPIPANAAQDRLIWAQGDSAQGYKSIRLNGASEWLAINGAGATLPAGALLDIEIIWTEQ